jgi:hypothetical protein
VAKQPGDPVFSGSFCVGRGGRRGEPGQHAGDGRA